MEIYRTLAKTNSKAFNPDFALSLKNLCLWLSALGRRKEALAAIEESVTIYRCLFGQTPAYFRPHLAKALNTFKSCLEAVGQMEEAHLIEEEAGRIS